MKTSITFIFLLAAVLFLNSCGQPQTSSDQGTTGIPVIFDTDANNELDDQHALAYLLLNDHTFDVIGITVNATWNGGAMDQHYEEAERVVKLCNLQDSISIYKGADGSFNDIAGQLKTSAYDGSEAVEFIIREAKRYRPETLVVLAVGKLTNVALAVKKEPSIAERFRLVWLGSNYPDPGEYNQDNDTAAMNFLLNSGVPFEMVTVRYGQSSGTAAVTVSRQEINSKMPGLGPAASEPVTGRHGGTFSCFGDYSVSLFEYIDYPDKDSTRALFDMAAVAIVKEPSWADRVKRPAPLLMNNQWVERPDNARSIIIWENFKKEPILNDFFYTMERSTPF